MFGMNPPRDGHRFRNMSEAFARDSVYWGERGEWLIVAAQNRDSDSLSRSNFQVLKERLDGRCEVENARHWAVGHIDYLIIDSHDKTAIRIAIAAAKECEDYPVLDESHWSKLEYTEAWEWAGRELNSFENWEQAFAEATENSGYDDESVGIAIENAREKLEKWALAYEMSAHSAIDPEQGKLFAEVSNCVHAFAIDELYED